MISMESIVFYSGVIYLCKLLINLVWDLKDGVCAYIFPKILTIDYKQKYGEWAIITGCTQGIGKCYAEELAKKGMHVLLISRNQTKLDNVAEELSNKYGVSTKTIAADFTNPDVLPRVVKEIEHLNIDIGVLVNNVGMLGPHHMPFVELEQEMVSGMVNVNILTATVLCHSLLPKMKKKGKGAVINVSSIANYFLGPYLAVYTATKHYLTAFTQSIAQEYSGTGITIQCVEPGPVETAMTQYFDKETKGPACPSPENYARSACATLGFTSTTTGYIGHSFLVWLVHSMCNPITNSLFTWKHTKDWKRTYENAKIMKQKSN